MEELEDSSIDVGGVPVLQDASETKAAGMTEGRMANWYRYWTDDVGGLLRLALLLGVLLGISAIILVVLALAGSPHQLTINSPNPSAMIFAAGSDYQGARDWSTGTPLLFDALYTHDEATGALAAISPHALSLYTHDPAHDARVYRVRGSLRVDTANGALALTITTNLPALSSIIVSQYELNVRAARLMRVAPVPICTDEHCTYRDPDQVAGHYLDTMKEYEIAYTPTTDDYDAIKEWVSIDSTELYVMLFTRDVDGELSPIEANKERLITTMHAS